MAAMVVYLQNLVTRLRERQEGQTMAEYALILGGIAVVVIAGILILGPAIRDLFSSTGSSVHELPELVAGQHRSTAGPSIAPIHKATIGGPAALQNLVAGLRERCERQAMTEEQAGTLRRRGRRDRRPPDLRPAIDDLSIRRRAATVPGTEAAPRRLAPPPSIDSRRPAAAAER